MMTSWDPLGIAASEDLRRPDISWETLDQGKIRNSAEKAWAPRSGPPTPWSWPERERNPSRQDRLVLQSQIRKSSLVMATPGSGLVASSPPRPIQDEIRQLVLRPYEAGEQSAHFRHCHGNQLFIRAVVAPLSPCSMA